MKHRNKWFDWAKTASMIVGASAAPVAIAWVGLVLYRSTFDVTKLSDSPDHWGQFGDFLGGIVNPSVGLVTIILLVWTLRSQQRELREQRAQFSLQAFEQTFFSWLHTLHESIKNMHAIDGTSEFRGQQVFNHITQWDPEDRPALLRIEEAILRSTSDESRLQAIQELQKLEAHIWSQRSQEAISAAATPTRLIVELLKFVANHPALNLDEKVRYLAVLRASISKANLRFLFLSSCHIQRHGTLGTVSAKFEFFRFLHTIRENSPLIAALLRYEAHTFSPSCFDEATLNALKGEIPQRRKQLNYEKATY